MVLSVTGQSTSADIRFSTIRMITNILRSCNHVSVFSDTDVDVVAGAFEKSFAILVLCKFDFFSNFGSKVEILGMFSLEMTA